MTIARDLNARLGSDGSASAPTGVEAPVPAAIRAERLASQVRSFERAGYRLETTAGFHAIVVRPAQPRRLRSAVLTVVTAGLYLVPILFGAGRTHHRVIISVDGSGAVRMA